MGLQLHVDLGTLSVKVSPSSPSIRLAFMFSGVSIVSAIFFGFFLCVDGVVGRTCGPYNNFTVIVRQVVDQPATWQGEYPLGRVLLGNSSYPLTVESFLDGCRRNQSLYNVMRLEQRYNLEEVIRIDPSEAVSVCVYVCAMSIHAFQLIPSLLEFVVEVGAFHLHVSHHRMPT